MTELDAPLSVADPNGLELVFAAISAGIDTAGSDHSALFLARLCLLLAQDVGDYALVARRIEEAQPNPAELGAWTSNAATPNARRRLPEDQGKG